MRGATNHLRAQPKPVAQPAQPAAKPFVLSDDARQRMATAIRGNTPSFIPITADANASYANPYAGQANRQTGNFGMGAGGPNRYDYTQLGAGLWSVGIDINAPDARAQVDRWMATLQPAERADVMRAVTRDQPGRGSMDAYVYGADARQRDVARKIQKENGFLSSTFGKVLGIAAPFALGAIGGPLVGMGASAAIGGATGGLPGAALGALGSAIAPALKLPSFGNALRAPVQAATSVASQFANPVTLGRQVASLGVGQVGRGRNA